MRWSGVLILCLGLTPAPVVAESDATLPDLRERLNTLYDELDDLRGVLEPQAQQGDMRLSGSPLRRLSAIESELRRLTAKTEELEYRIDRIVRDGTARIGDLDYRLCALEPGCAPAKLSAPQPLGGAEVAPVGPVPRATMNEAPVALLEGAKAALEAGQFDAAHQGFVEFLATRPSSDRLSEAELLRGHALLQLQDAKGAARAFLAAFSADRQGPFAPEALTELGRAMGEIGQVNEACATLSEVVSRFPQSPLVPDARAALAQWSCP